MPKILPDPSPVGAKPSANGHAAMGALSGLGDRLLKAHERHKGDRTLPDGSIAPAPRPKLDRPRLEWVAEHFEDCRKVGSGYLARCPAHDDDTPSLSINKGEDGRILLHCFACCETKDVIAHVGLTFADLAPDGGDVPEPDRLPNLRTVAKLLAALQHDTAGRRAFLKSAGLADTAVPAHACVRLSRAIHAEVDKHQDEADHVTTYKGLDDHDRDSVPRQAGLNTRRLSEVQEKEVRWLWRQRVPLGKLTILSGDPGLGKTWVALDVIARLTTGRGMPDGPHPFGGKRRDALWVSAEDADDDTVRPRVRMLGGDLSRVRSLQFIFEEGKERTLDLSRHLEQLDKWLSAHPLAAVVVIDPLAAFLGKVDSHRNSDVRALLTPVAKLAEKHGVAVIGINHLSKGGGDNAIYRGMGSVAFVAAARSSWLVTRDVKEKNRRLLTEVKGNNRSEEVGGLAFRIVQDGIRWDEGPVSVTADEALRPPEESRAPAKAEAKDWLRELLKAGPVLADEVWARADADGLCRKTVRTASKELGVRTKKTGGTGAPWAWSLPKR